MIGDFSMKKPAGEECSEEKADLLIDFLDE